MRRSAIILISAGASFVLLASGATAGAAIAGGPVDSSGVIHGCWTNAAINGTHVFVLQDAGTNCPKGTTAISWNQQGPAGPAGPAGAAGPQGPAGPPGAIGPEGPKGDTGAQGSARPAGGSGPAGPAGPQGPQGPAGADGNTVLNGTGAPADTVGHDGDFYLDTAADVLYGPKASSTWPATGTSLVGNPGATGAAGPAGPPGPAGPQGPAGTGSLTSLDALGGLPCTPPGSGHGTISVTYGTGNAVSLSCAGPFTWNLTVNVTGEALAGSPCGPFGENFCPGVGYSGTVTSAPAGLSCSSQGNANNGFSVTNSCTAGFAVGSQVTLTESTSDTFEGWSGACSGTATTCTITLGADTEVGATFGGSE